jgi:hypothetical protein
MRYNNILKLANVFYSIATDSLNNILKEISNLETFQDQVDYAEKKLDHLSSGSSRIVYKTSDGTAIKLAKNNKGLAQNEAEAKLKLKSDYINKVIKSDKNFKWIEVPLLEKITEKEFEELTSFKFKDFEKAMGVEISSKKTKPKNFDDISKSELFKDMVKACKKHNLLYGDIVRISSWGQKNNKPILIDAGLTKKIYEEYYDSQS